MKRLVCLVAFAILAVPTCAGAQTLRTVKERGVLNCGVSQGIYGFSAADDAGNWSGFDVDFCRAVAAAIFNEAGKVKFVPLSTVDRFARLRAGEVDVLARNSTWTLSREAELGLSFAAVTYYDGQGFLVRSARNVESVLELDGARVCVQTGTTTEANLSDYFSANQMAHESVTLTSVADVRQAYEARRCDAITSDVSQL